MRSPWGPHGGEVMLDQWLVRDAQTARVRVRRSAAAVQSAWGVGGSVTSLAEVQGVTLDGSADVWSQPALRLDRPSPAARRAAA